jgi:tRNA pseudouridine38-40 synthase|tara:strand:+ start:4398 stop:5180 length:783 start_codon:yes stop_codon:yes gene_type:complete
MSLRIALGVEYDGSEYFGFQKQKTTNQTIQGLLETSASKVADHKVKTFCSGRTDAGVHAFMQVIHFDTDAIRSSREWLRGINSYLPSDIRVIWSKEMDESFHARFSATRRSYLYNIFNNQTPSALWSDRSLFVTQQLDIRSMRAASKYLIGEHDFTSFRGSGCQSKTSLRNIDNIEISKKDRFIRVELSANAFLLHMVRIIIGTLLMVGKKEIKPKEVENILKQQDRRLAGKTVSSSGLFFLGPEYPQKYKIPGFQNNLI